MENEIHNIASDLSAALGGIRLVKDNAAKNVILSDICFKVAEEVIGRFGDADKKSSFAFALEALLNA